MEQIEAKNCWEYWNCDPDTRRDCPAFKTDAGNICWDVVGSFTRHAEARHCKNLQKNFQFCWQCPWFKLKNPDYKPK